MSEYRRGADFERKVVNDYKARGWYASRTPGSKSPIDIIAFRAGEVHIIQCKLTGRMSGAAKEQLREMAHENWFRAYLCWNDKGAIRFEELVEVEAHV